MKNKFLVLSICLIAIGSITIAMANLNSGIEIPNSSIVKTPITQEYASSVAAKLLPVDKAKVNLRSDNLRLNWEFAYIEGNHSTFVNIDANTGEVIGYFNSSKTSNKKTITADKALIMAKNQLIQYGINIDSLKVLQPRTELIENPYEKTYAIIWMQQEKGVPVFGKFISARVNANTGELIHFVNKTIEDPGIAAIDTTPKINGDDAIKVAGEFLNKSYGLPFESKLLSSTMEIRKPNDWANTRNTTPIGSYTLVWIVTFEDKAGDHLVQAWVDAHTGDLIGGDRCK